MAVKGILQIEDILNDYSEDIQTGIIQIAKDIAKEDASKLRNTKNTYTIRSGKYNRGWSVKTEKKANGISCIVHNKDHYQLTHLLEKGHDIVDRHGMKKGHAKAFPHIAPVEEQSNKQFTLEVENLIKNGG